MAVGDGVSLGAARVKLIVDLSDLNNIRVVTQQAGQAAERNLNRIGTSAKNAERGIRSLGDAFGKFDAVVAGAGVFAALQLAQTTLALAEAAAQAAVTRESFEGLADSVGESADVMLAGMREASRGTISDTNLIIAANRAMISGVADSSAELNQLLEISRAVAKNFGVSTTEAFNRVVQSLAKLEPELIDEIGVTVRLDTVFRKYAASLGVATAQLTEAQRRTAFFNEVVRQTQPLVDANADAIESESDKFGQFAADLDNAKVALGEFLLAAGVTDSLDTFADSAEDSVEQIERFTSWINTLRDAFNNFSTSSGLAEYLRIVRSELQAVQDLIAGLGVAIGTRPAFDVGTAHRGDIGRGASAARQRAISRSNLDAAETPVIDQAKLLDAQRDFARGMEDINRNSGQAIQDATEQFSRQRAETIRNYEKSIVREEEDFLRARARQQRDYERSILEIVRDAREREAEWAAQLDETITEARQDSNERIGDIERNFNRQRERAERDSRERILDAAARLDATAVFQEQRDAARAAQDAEQDRNEQLDQERKNLRKQIDQAQEAHDERLEDARKADARRLEDMRLALEQQRADEDEDRRIQKDRAAQDHQENLAQQAADHALNLQRIAREAAEQRRRLTESFQEQLIDLGLFNIAYRAERLRAQRQELEDIAPFMKGWFNTLKEAMQATFPNHPSNADPYIGRTVPTGARASSRTVSSITMQAGAVTVYAAPGQSEEEIGRIAVDQMAKYLEARLN